MDGTPARTEAQQAALAAKLAEMKASLETPQWQIEQALNTPGPGHGTDWRRVRIKDARSVFRKSLAPGSTMETRGGPLTARVALDDAARDPNHAAHNIARSAVELFSDEDGEIDATDMDERDLVLALLSSLVGAGVLSENAFARLLGLMTRERSWAEVNGFEGGVTAREIGLALGAH